MTEEQRAKQREYQRTYRERNRERLNEKNRAYVAANRKADNARQRAWRAANPDKAAAIKQRYVEKKLGAAYGLAPDDYTRLLSEQGGVCAICTAPQRHRTFTRLVIDHDHATGKVRGLLCSQCTTAIGMTNDSPARLRAAAAYLERTC